MYDLVPALEEIINGVPVVVVPERWVWFPDEITWAPRKRKVEDEDIPITWAPRKARKVSRIPLIFK